MESHSRQRLRPWLEARIESQELPGLTWLDKKKQIFRVPWKHGGKHDWNEQHSLIFKEWAVHTGRYREGVDTPDWPTWKTRFRCALNKLPDIREEKELSSLEGPDPFRAYKFMPKSTMTSTRSDTKMLAPASQRSKERQQGTHMTIDQQDGIFNLLNEATNDNNLPSDLNEMNFDYLPREDICMETSDGSNDSNFVTIPNVVDTNQNSHFLIKQEELSPPTTHSPPGLPPLTMEAPANQVHVTVQYRDNLILQCDINNTQGCRLIYRPDGPQIQTPDIIKKMAYGPDGADDIIFPMIETPDCDQQSRLTAHLLRALERGVYLHCKDGDIYATRKCKCVVFVQSQSENKEPYKLIRDETTQIFNFETFLTELYLYLNGQGAKPLPCVLLGLGQNWKNSSNPQNTLLISANIYSSKARHMIQKVSCSSPLSPPVEVSRSDEIDRYMRQLKDVDVLNYQAPNPMVCYQ